MERYTMLLDWMHQYCRNEYTIQCNLQIQGNPYQITNGILHRTRFVCNTKYFKLCMETQKTPNSQITVEKEKWNRRSYVPCLQTIL